MSRIAVLGGGVTGLTAARDLHQAGADVVLLEAASRLGGKIDSTPVAGRPADLGADCFLARVPFARNLAIELGLGDQLVAPAPAKPAYVRRAGVLHPIPEGTVLGAPVDLDKVAATSDLLSAEALARIALDRTNPNDHPAGDTSLGEMVRRRMGDEVLEWLVDPLLGGINAGDSDLLSLRAGAPQFAAAINDHASLAEGLEALMAKVPPSDLPIFNSFPGGVVTLINALVDDLTGKVDLRVDSPIESLALDGNGWRIAAGGDEVQADSIFIALPAHAAGPLLTGVADEASGILSAIDHASVSQITIAIPTEAVGADLDASGYIVPKPEGMLMTAATWFSTKWAHYTHPTETLIRVTSGRYRDTRTLEMDDETLTERLLSELTEIVPLSGDPIDVRVHRWLDTFPQYTVGHLDRMDVVRAELAGLAAPAAIAGMGIGGIGIPACVGQAHTATKTLVA